MERLEDIYEDQYDRFLDWGKEENSVIPMIEHKQTRCTGCIHGWDDPLSCEIYVCKPACVVMDQTDCIYKEIV